MIPLAQLGAEPVDGWTSTQVTNALNRLLQIQTNTLAGAVQTAEANAKLDQLNAFLGGLQVIGIWILCIMLVWIGFQLAGFFVPSSREMAF